MITCGATSESYVASMCAPYSCGGGNARGSTCYVDRHASAFDFDCPALPVFAFAGVVSALPKCTVAQNEKGATSSRDTGGAAIWSLKDPTAASMSRRIWDGVRFWILRSPVKDRTGRNQRTDVPPPTEYWSGAQRAASYPLVPGHRPVPVLPLL